MNSQVDPAQLPLRDIHLPDPVAWWPPAFGWWLLSGALIAIAVVLAVRAWRSRRHRAARRELAAIVKALEAGAEPGACVREASIVLRRFAMTIDRQSGDIAGRVGDAWLSYLATRADDPHFGAAAAPLLLDSPYRAPGAVTVEEAQAVCRACADWITAQPVRA